MDSTSLDHAEAYARAEISSQARRFHLLHVIPGQRDLLRLQEESERALWMQLRAMELCECRVELLMVLESQRRQERYLQFAFERELLLEPQFVVLEKITRFDLVAMERHERRAFSEFAAALRIMWQSVDYHTNPTEWIKQTLAQQHPSSQAPLSREVMESFFLPSKPSYDRRGWRPQSAQTKTVHSTSTDGFRPSSARKPRPPSASAQFLLTDGQRSPTCGGGTSSSRVSGQVLVGHQLLRPNGLDHREAPYFTTHYCSGRAHSSQSYTTHQGFGPKHHGQSLLLLTSSRASVNETKQMLMHMPLEEVMRIVPMIRVPSRPSETPLPAAPPMITPSSPPKDKLVKQKAHRPTPSPLVKQHMVPEDPTEAAASVEPANAAATERVAHPLAPRQMESPSLSTTPRTVRRRIWSPSVTQPVTVKTVPPPQAAKPQLKKKKSVSPTVRKSAPPAPAVAAPVPKETSPPKPTKRVLSPRPPKPPTPPAGDTPSAAPVPAEEKKERKPPSPQRRPPSAPRTRGQSPIAVRSLSPKSTTAKLVSPQPTKKKTPKKSTTPKQILSSEVAAPPLEEEKVPFAVQIVKDVPRLRHQLDVPPARWEPGQVLLPLEALHLETDSKFLSLVDKRARRARDGRSTEDVEQSMLKHCIQRSKDLLREQLQERYPFLPPTLQGNVDIATLGLHSDGTLQDLVQLLEAISTGDYNHKSEIASILFTHPKGRHAMVDFLNPRPWPAQVLALERERNIATMVALNNQQRRAHDEVSLLSPYSCDQLTELCKGAIDNYLARRAMLVQRLELQRSIPSLIVQHYADSDEQRLDVFQQFEHQWMEGDNSILTPAAIDQLPSRLSATKFRQNFSLFLLPAECLDLLQDSAFLQLAAQLPSSSSSDEAVNQRLFDHVARRARLGRREQLRLQLGDECAHIAGFPLEEIEPYVLWPMLSEVSNPVEALNVVHSFYDSHKINTREALYLGLVKNQSLLWHDKLAFITQSEAGEKAAFKVKDEELSLLETENLLDDNVFLSLLFQLEKCMHAEDSFLIRVQQQRIVDHLGRRVQNARQEIKFRERLNDLAKEELQSRLETTVTERQKRTALRRSLIQSGCQVDEVDFRRSIAIQRERELATLKCGFDLLTRAACLYGQYVVTKKMWDVESESTIKRQIYFKQEQANIRDAHNAVKYLAHLYQQDSKVLLAEMATRQRHEAEEEGIRSAVQVAEELTRRELLRSDREMLRARERIVQEEEVLRFKDIERKEVETRRAIRESFLSTAPTEAAPVTGSPVTRHGIETAEVEDAERLQRLRLELRAQSQFSEVVEEFQSGRRALLKSAPKDLQPSSPSAPPPSPSRTPQLRGQLRLQKQRNATRDEFAVEESAKRAAIKKEEQEAWEDLLGLQKAVASAIASKSPERVKRNPSPVVRLSEEKQPALRPPSAGSKHNPESAANQDLEKRYLSALNFGPLPPKGLSPSAAAPLSTPPPSRNGALTPSKKKVTFSIP